MNPVNPLKRTSLPLTTSYAAFPGRKDHDSASFDDARPASSTAGRLQYVFRERVRGTVSPVAIHGQLAHRGADREIAGGRRGPGQAPGGLYSAASSEIA